MGRGADAASSKDARLTPSVDKTEVFDELLGYDEQLLGSTLRCVLRERKPPVCKSADQER